MLNKVMKPYVIFKHYEIDLRIKTKIRGGLPIFVQGVVTPGVGVQIEAVRFLSGHSFPIAIPGGFPEKELERIENELIDAAKMLSQQQKKPYDF